MNAKIVQLNKPAEHTDQTKIIINQPNTGQKQIIHQKTLLKSASETNIDHKLIVPQNVLKKSLTQPNIIQNPMIPAKNDQNQPNQVKDAIIKPNQVKNIVLNTHQEIIQGKKATPVVNIVVKPKDDKSINAHIPAEKEQVNLVVKDKNTAELPNEAKDHIVQVLGLAHSSNQGSTPQIS